VGFEKPRTGGSLTPTKIKQLQRQNRRFFDSKRFSQDLELEVIKKKFK
jgi:hypothetical protein